MTLESPRSAPLLLALIVSDLDPINGKAWGSCQIKSFSMFKVYCINFGRILPCHYFQPSEICLPSHAASVGKMMLKRSILRPSSYLHRELNVSEKTLLDQVFGFYRWRQNLFRVCVWRGGGVGVFGFLHQGYEDGITVRRPHQGEAAAWGVQGNEGWGDSSNDHPALQQLQGKQCPEKVANLSGPAVCHIRNHMGDVSHCTLACKAAFGLQQVWWKWLLGFMGILVWKALMV